VVQVDAGWHINAHRPRQAFLIGTTFELEPHPGFLLADARYPEPEAVKFGFFEEHLAVYEGAVPVFLSIRAAPDLSPGPYTLNGRLRVQACNDQICLAPSTLDVSIPVRAVDQATALHATGEDI